MGCGKSKNKAPAAAAPAEQKPEEPKPETPKADEAKAPAGRTLPIKIASAHGLRAADLIGNKSDVFVEVSIEGKPQSKITTAVVSGKAAPRAGAAKGEKDSVEVELNFVGELQNFAAGDKVLFTVKDKDVVAHDFLGKAVVTDNSFGGKLVLEGAGDACTAFLMVQVGEGSAMTEAIEVMKDLAEKAKQALAAAVGSGSAKAAQETIEDVQLQPPGEADDTNIKSGMFCGC